MSVCRTMTALVLLMTTGWAATSVAAESSAKGWQSSFEAAQAAAKKQNKPLLMHFYADWCGPCRAMEGTILNTPDVLRHLGTSVIAVKINSDQRQDLVSRYGISGLPTDVFVSPDGEVISRSVGSPGKEGYVARMTNVAAKFAPAASKDQMLAKGGQSNHQSAAVEVAPKTAASATALGLEGYSPVSLIADRVWEKGDASFAVEYEGIVYYLASEAEQQTFKANPARYAPSLKGNDPCLLSTNGQVVPGDIRYGAFYDGQLFLHSSDESREKFKEDPTRYTQTVRVLLADRSTKQSVN